MSAVSEFESGIVSVIRQAWGELFGDSRPILRVTQAERIAWRTLFEKRELEAPWAVVQTPALQQVEGWGACNEVYSPTVRVFYVTTADEVIKAGYGDAAAFIHARLDSLADALKAGNYTGFQFWWGLERDVSESNPIHAAMAGSNLPLHGGSLAFRVLFGEIEREN